MKFLFNFDEKEIEAILDAALVITIVGMVLTAATIITMAVIG